MLISELQSCVQQRGSFNYIHCPEIVELYCGTEMEDNLLNQQYEIIRTERQKMMSGGDFERYIFRTARPYRLEALGEVIMQDKLDAERLAKLIMEVWTDSENPSEALELWRGLFGAFRNCKTFTTSKAALPDKFVVWRGGTADGLSWTLDEKIARWFAKRFGKNEQILHREITRTEAVCYLPDRGEKEVILIK